VAVSLSTRELLEELALRMERTQNSTRGRDLGVLCREALEGLDASVLGRRPPEDLREQLPPRHSRVSASYGLSPTGDGPLASVRLAFGDPVDGRRPQALLDPEVLPDLLRQLRAIAEGLAGRALTRFDASAVQALFAGGWPPTLRLVAEDGS
jgi:hypothetical protein